MAYMDLLEDRVVMKGMHHLVVNQYNRASKIEKGMQLKCWEQV